MIQRFYVHNFRCLENFEMTLRGISSCLILGRNGSGKSTILCAMKLLQKIARGVNRIGHLVSPDDYSRGRSDVPMRFELDVRINDREYRYSLALELPEHFKELRVLEENLFVDGLSVFSRSVAQVALNKNIPNTESAFLVDWHLVALPIIQVRSVEDPVHRFREWLARTVILAPIPKLMNGVSTMETLDPEEDGSNFTDWFSGLLTRYPASYTMLDQYIRGVIPDFKDFQMELIGKNSKSLMVRFEAKQAQMKISFNALSDGEKCFFLGALVIAANETYGPIFCLWDEPDSYLSISEIGQFITTLRRSFIEKGQLVVTSHDLEAIHKFSDENTILLHRKSHLEPTLLSFLDKLDIRGDLGNALIQGTLYS